MGAHAGAECLALQRSRKVPGLTIYGRAHERGGIVSFNLSGAAANDLAAFLDQRGIAVRSGHHCAHVLMERLGVPATVRASAHLYNLHSELDVLVEAAAESGEVFRSPGGGELPGSG